MIESKEFINEGGIIGTGTGYTDENSEEVIMTMKMIRERYETYSPEKKLGIKLSGLKAEMFFFVDDKRPRNNKNVAEYLQDFVSTIGITHKKIAAYLEIKESNFSAILNGKRRINADFAFKLGQLFDMQPELWLQVQSKHEMLEMEKNQQSNGKKYNLEELLSLKSEKNKRPKLKNKRKTREQVSVEG